MGGDQPDSFSGIRMDRSAEMAFPGRSGWVGKGPPETAEANDMARRERRLHDSDDAKKSQADCKRSFHSSMRRPMPR